MPPTGRATLRCDDKSSRRTCDVENCHENLTDVKPRLMVFDQTYRSRNHPRFYSFLSVNLSFCFRSSNVNIRILCYDSFPFQTRIYSNMFCQQLNNEKSNIYAVINQYTCILIANIFEQINELSNKLDLKKKNAIFNFFFFFHAIRKMLNYLTT